MLILVRLKICQYNNKTADRGRRKTKRSRRRKREEVKGDKEKE